MNYEGNSSTTWWNMVDNKTAGHIDFTNPKAAKWFQNRLKSLQKETGVDSFKFDAGETDWLPPVTIFIIFDKIFELIESHLCKRNTISL